MTALLCKGDNDRHHKKAEWGIGKITEGGRCGTIRVLFEDLSEISVANGLKHLVKVDV